MDSGLERSEVEGAVIKLWLPRDRVGEFLVESWGDVAEGSGGGVVPEVSRTWDHLVAHMTEVLVTVTLVESCTSEKETTYPACTLRTQSPQASPTLLPTASALSRRCFSTQLKQSLSEPGTGAAHHITYRHTVNIDLTLCRVVFPTLESVGKPTRQHQATETALAIRYPGCVHQTAVNLHCTSSLSTLAL
jgi:hypothetical protein